MQRCLWQVSCQVNLWKSDIIIRKIFDVDNRHHDNVLNLFSTAKKMSETPDNNLLALHDFPDAQKYGQHRRCYGDYRHTKSLQKLLHKIKALEPDYYERTSRSRAKKLAIS